MAIASRNCAVGSVCCVGLLVCIVGIIIISGNPDQEVSVWFNVPLCKTQTASQYASREMGSSDACPATLEAGAAQTVSLPVDSSMFQRNVPYNLFSYRSDGTSFDSSKNGKLEVAVEGQFSRNWQTDFAATRRLERTGRRLLKGSTGGSSYSGSSYSSGSTYRSRSSYSSYGSTVYTRRYGRTGPTSINRGVVVMVYSPSPMYGTRLSTGSGYRSQYTTRCSSRTTGCEYSVASDLTKDEWTKATLTVGDDAPATFNLTVSALVHYTPTAQFPNLFFSFATAEGGSSTGAIVLGVGFAIMLIGSTITSLYFRRCHKQNYNPVPSTDPVAPGASAGTGVDWNAGTQPQQPSAPVAHVVPPNAGMGAGMGAGVGNTFAVADAMRVPMIAAAGGTLINNSNGDWQNFALINDLKVSTIVAPHNDVSNWMGLERLTNVQVVDASDNNLSTLVGIYAPGLTSLNLNSNDMRSLDGIQGCPNLRWLSVSNNDLSSLGITTRMHALTFLNVRANELKSLSSYELSNYPALTHLDAANNDISDISGLRNLASLQAADLSNNYIRDAATVLSLAQLPNLRFLNLRGNNFTAQDINAIRQAFNGRAVTVEI